ncbi:MAG: phage protease [Verrucomicrobia bacterium]|nr:phage protease [Verrucomicrobiota bacterium]
MKSNLDLLLGLRLTAFASAAELPKRFKILSWGDNKTASGRPARVGGKTLATLSAMQSRMGFEEVALDFEHNTVPGTKAHKESSEPRPVAAYGTLDVVQGEGLFFNVSRWTPEGTRSALNFQDLSPAPATDDAGEVIFVHSVALCRNGDVEGLHFVTLSVETGNQEELVMDYKAILVKLLKLPEAATDADIEKAATAVSEPAPAPMTAKVTDLEGKIVSLTADVAAVKAADLKRQRDAIVSGAVAAGKVIPLTAEQIAAMDLAALSTMVEKLPATVPLDQRTPRVEPLTAQGGNPVIAQYNAIKDPVERARFYSENRTKILGNG